MNTDPTRPGQTPAEEPTGGTTSRPTDQPTPIGEGLAPVEDRLRRALDADARSIAPGDRLAAILTDAHSGPGTTAGSAPDRHHRWVLPAAAAAAAVLVAGTVWAVNRPPSQTPLVIGASTAVGTSAPTPSARSSAATSVPTQTAPRPSAPSATSTPAPPTKGAGAPVTASASVPVYYLGPVAGASGPLRLFREFVAAQVPSPSAPSGNALAALRLAMGPAPAGSRYHSAWTGVTADAVTRGERLITVRLSKGTQDASPLATEQLVWTVQAALGAALPVRFELADGGTEVSPGHPASATYTRPSDPIAVLDQVAPIWVDEPARGTTVPVGRPLSVKGVASTFEANVEWELLRDGRRVDSGFTTATEAAPARATYRFTTKKPLASGTYTLRVFESSAKDGSTAAEQTLTVTAR
ncbi:Gmad2 immunoglobulin-like domain-containing protein [Terrabacter sp. C0L_2]|jgi:hypothetical protein|uniref:Gmad2 immunoglobulin-like domain-containing protein n=1 Tax=Terrabacter sp. C0L_2 TaxID=3108389 RepID=UPI002ED3A102|nr:Gmad2 immunoglobulin-like domain-containing protein [Terrabacter sp. C0L_2]